MLIEIYRDTIFFDPWSHPGKVYVPLHTFKREDLGLFLEGDRQPVVDLELEGVPSLEVFELLIPTEEKTYEVRHVSVTKQPLRERPFPLIVRVNSTTGAVWVQYNTAIAVVTPARN